MNRKIKIVAIFLSAFLVLHILFTNNIKARWYNKKALDLFYNNYSDYHYNSLLYDQIVNKLKEAIRMDSTYKESYKNLSMVYTDNEEFDKAIQVLRLYSKLRPNEYGHKIQLYNLYYKLNKADSAQYYFSEIFLGFKNDIDNAKNNETKVAFKFSRELVRYEIGDKQIADENMKKIIEENSSHKSIDNMKVLYNALKRND